MKRNDVASIILKNDRNMFANLVFRLEYQKDNRGYCAICERQFPFSNSKSRWLRDQYVKFGGQLAGAFHVWRDA